VNFFLKYLVKVKVIHCILLCPEIFLKISTVIFNVYFLKEKTG
jgi:hypothetical protein